MANVKEGGSIRGAMECDEDSNRAEDIKGSKEEYGMMEKEKDTHNEYGKGGAENNITGLHYTYYCQFIE